jgi:hypothetical protein
MQDWEGTRMRVDESNSGIHLHELLFMNDGQFKRFKIASKPVIGNQYATLIGSGA